MDYQRARERQAYVLGAYISSLSIVLEFLSAPEARFPEHERLRGVGTEGDGIVAILPVDKVYNIRTRSEEIPNRLQS